MLTISQLAAYCGVTVRTVRHYHQIGLLPEPKRDHSGYRRYDADAVIILTRIHTLTDAGVPLAEVPHLLDADPHKLSERVDELDRTLRARMRALEATRSRLAALRDGPAGLLPAGLASHLDRLEQLGLDEEALILERDTWVLLAVLYPVHYRDWIADLDELLTHEDVADLYRRIHQARHWQPDDPRLTQLAADTRRLAERHRNPAPASTTVEADPRAMTILLTHAGDTSPAWNRLAQLAKDSGPTGQDPCG